MLRPARIGPSTEHRNDAAREPEWEAALWQRLRESGDMLAREDLMQHHLPYARVVAASYYARRMHDEIEFAEYLQLASVGLVESIDRYDPARGAQFRTFAARRMHGAILNGLERLTEKQQQIAACQRLRHERLHAIKAEAEGSAAEHSSSAASAAARRAEKLFGYLAEVGIGLALGYLLEGTGMVDNPSDPATVADTHYQPLELRQLQRHIRELVLKLPEQERTVVRYHYLQERGFDEIASTLGVTKGRVSQIHRKALIWLRSELAARPHCDVSW